ncbi:sperm equatorial segment protein 1 [Phodopus roborovskii]|uniref:sperm equatorial segment protein 1 n=1 Tax=Phodopus roborovskii TaxID=109678 RepID=UPI0021E3FCEC|nr:sperm equatorial segment protein 1 [Phodopus roborovskii]
MKPVVLVVLWLWPSSLLAYPTITVLPDEEQNLNHYVQVLQNLIMSVPTREQGSDKKSEASRTMEVAEPRSSPELLMHTPDEVTSENDVLIRPISQEMTTFSTSGFTMDVERKKKTESTAFWSIRPNNISIVLHTDEPYIEKEEPEPEPEPESESASRPTLSEPELHPESEPEPELEPETTQEPQAEDLESDTRQNRLPTEIPRMSSMVTHPWLASTHVTITRTTSNMDFSTDSEDVPQLSGQSETESIEDISGSHSQSLKHEEILRKISNINAEIQRGPLGDSNNPEYKEYIKASREHLKRSLALAAAAEHKLQQMYRSRVFPVDQMSDSADDMETVINMLYNSRSKLSEYLNIKHIPTELREKATAVTGVLKKLLCVDQVERQRFIRKLISNNMKILNILDAQ